VVFSFITPCGFTMEVVVTKYKLDNVITQKKII